MGVGVAHLRVGRIQVELGSAAGGADIGQHFPIQLYDQLGIRTVGGNIADDIAVFILTPRPDGQVGFRLVDDLLAFRQIRFDFDVIFSPVLVGDIDGKTEYIAGIIHSFDLEGVFSGLALF